jgi:multidrug efflux pump
LVTATGAGSEMRHAMGIAVFFGMLGVTWFGLFLTPVFYVIVRALGRRGLTSAAGHEPPAPAAHQELSAIMDSHK